MLDGTTDAWWKRGEGLAEWLPGWLVIIATPTQVNLPVTHFTVHRSSIHASFAGTNVRFPLWNPRDISKTMFIREGERLLPLCYERVLCIPRVDTVLCTRVALNPHARQLDKHVHGCVQALPPPPIPPSLSAPLPPSPACH